MIIRTVAFENKLVNCYEEIPINHFKFVSKGPYSLPLNNKNIQLLHIHHTTIMMVSTLSSFWNASQFSAKLLPLIHGYPYHLETVQPHFKALPYCKEHNFHSKVLCTNTARNSRKQWHLVAGYYKTEQCQLFYCSNWKTCNHSTHILERQLNLEV